jgi:hypothetical protein
MPQYRLVGHATGHARLMERPGDPPQVWRATFAGADGPISITIGDSVEVVDHVPRHLGFLVQVDRPDADMDSAVGNAMRDAETALMFVSSLVRAPISTVEPVVAYEITTGITHRPFRQWFLPPVGTGKVAMREGALDTVLGAYLGSSDDKLRWRLAQSMSWHRSALTFVEPLQRFMQLWMAAEALEPRLVELFGPFTHPPPPARPPAFPGLRALATAAGHSNDPIAKTKKLRDELFHTLRIDGRELVNRATELIPFLENLLPVAWGGLLGIADFQTLGAEAATTPHPMRLLLSATIIEPDSARWGWGKHPQFDGALTTRRIDSDDPRDVHVSYEQSFNGKNFDEFQPGGMSMWGPTGPSVGEATLESTRVVREDGTIEDLPLASEDR